MKIGRRENRANGESADGKGGERVYELKRRGGEDATPS